MRCGTQVERLQRQADDLKGDKEDLLRDVSRLKDAMETMRATSDACSGSPSSKHMLYTLASAI